MCAVLQKLLQIEIAIVLAFYLLELSSFFAQCLDAFRLAVMPNTYSFNGCSPLQS